LFVGIERAMLAHLRRPPICETHKGKNSRSYRQRGDEASKENEIALHGEWRNVTAKVDEIYNGSEQKNR